MVLLIVSLFIGLFLFSMGFLLNEKSATSMISGFKKLSDEEQKQVQLVEYVNFFRKFHFTIGILIIVLSTVFYFVKLFDFIGFTLLFFSLAGYTFFIFRSQFYYPPQKRKPFIISFYIMLIVSIGVIVLFIIPYQETKIEIFDNQLKISGIYGEDLSIDQINDVKLIKQLPNIKIKTNGFAMSNLKKGWFKLKSGEKVKLIINDTNPPFLQISTNQNYSIIIGIKTIDEVLLNQQLNMLKK